MVCRTLQFLIAHGANVHQQDLEGNTRLHEAVRREDLEMTQALLELGVKADQPNHQGVTAIDLAKNNEREEILELLKRNNDGK